MATFNQQGQTVHQQFNAETINFGQVATAQDFVAQLKQLQSAINQAAQAKTLNTQQAQDADSHLQKAMQQAQQTQPDKQGLIQHLKALKDTVSGIDGLARAVGRAITSIGALF